jgi:hypothetical protein
MTQHQRALDTELIDYLHPIVPAPTREDRQLCLVYYTGLGLPGPLCGATYTPRSKPTQHRCHAVLQVPKHSRLYR